MTDVGSSFRTFASEANILVIPISALFFVLLFGGHIFDPKRSRPLCAADWDWAAGMLICSMGLREMLNGKSSSSSSLRNNTTLSSALRFRVSTVRSLVKVPIVSLGFVLCSYLRLKYLYLSRSLSTQEMPP